MYECLYIYFILCVTIQYFRFQNYFLVLHDVPGSYCIFPAPASDSTISSRIRGSFFWRIFREDLGTHVLIVTRVSLLFVPLRTYTFTHLYFFLYVCTCIYVKNRDTSNSKNEVHSSIFLYL